MVSRMDSICERYAAGCTKTEPKILQVKRGQKQRNAPGKARKRRNRVRSGCWRGVQPVRTGGETRNPNQNAPDSNATHEKRKPAKTQCFRRFFGRGRRTWSPLRSGRLVACVPPARTRPSARGFGVDVGKRTRGTGEGQCCPVSNASPGEDGAGLVLWEIFRAKTGEKEREIPEKT